MKSHISFFLQLNHIFLSHAAGIYLPCNDATGEQEILDIVCSGTSKKILGDTRNNLVTMMFITRNRYNCFRKQIYIDTCIQAFYDLTPLWFEFDDFGFAISNVHFFMNIPKRNSVQVAEIILKSYTAGRCLNSFRGFEYDTRAGGFWSRNDHYELTGWKNLEQSHAYVRDQPLHHNIKTIDDRQQRLPTMTAE